MRRLVAAIELLLRFLWQVVLSGLATAWLIVKPGRRPQPMLLRMSYGPIDPRGAALLGCLITLTPGTTTLDVDAERRELLLHLLDDVDPEGAVAGIRHEFERPLKVLFPLEDGR